MLDEQADSPAMRKLQAEILQDEVVKKVFSWQEPNGWLGNSFHSDTGAETGIRLLAEKGVERSHPVLVSALQVLEDNPTLAYGGIGLPGRVLDDSRFGGAHLIRACVAAYTGLEDRPFILEQVSNTIEVFKKAVQVQSVEDLYEIYRAKKVFRKGIYWPCIYHLRLLAFTHTWRTAENQSLVGEVLRKLVAFSPIPPILFRYRSQLVAPASFGMENFNPDMNTLGDNLWMVWFHRMEVVARLGVIAPIPELRSQVEALQDMLLAGDGLFTKPLSHNYFQRWSAYSGLMIEQDWKTAQRRVNDLTFRALLILHYASFLA
ncbi:MAG TPA: hypothetical protein VN376_03200 [Longilinea sp.]|nr:hypothetical protein [Longilinea sp.]